MKCRINLFPYFAMSAVMLLLSLLAVGYATFSDSLQVNGTITLATPTPAPTAPPSPPGFSISGTGYYYWSNQLFSGPNWSCFYQVKPSTNLEDHKSPASFWSGNVLTFTNTINIQIPTNGVPNNKLLNGFRSEVRAAISYRNTSGHKLQFSQVSKSSGINQNFVRLSDMSFKMDGKNIDLQNSDTMVISVFCEDNWAIANQYLDLERLPGKTHTENKQVKFKIYDTHTKITQEFIMKFELTITAVDVLPLNASSTDMSMGLQSDVEDGFDKPMILLPESDFTVPLEIIPSPATIPTTNVSIPTMPDVSISDSGYRDNYNNTFSAPYWAYTYSDRAGQSIQNDANPVAYWDGDALIIYNNIFIPPSGSPDEALLKSFNSNAGAALRFYNGTQDDLEFTPVSISSDLSQSFALMGGPTINSSRLTLPPGETCVISSYMKDSWQLGSNGLDLEHLPGMNYMDDQEMTFRVTNLATKESRTYTLKFVISLKTMAAIPTPTPTSQPTTAPTPVPILQPTPEPSLMATVSVTETPIVEPSPTPSASTTVMPGVEPSPTPITHSSAAPTAEVLPAEVKTAKEQVTSTAPIQTPEASPNMQTPQPSS